MRLPKKVAALISHVEEYAARYAVLAIGVLTPASGWLGTLAAHAGGVNTSTGRALLGMSSAAAVALTGAMFLKNLGHYQIVRDFDSAFDIEPPDDGAATTPVVPDGGA